MTPEYRLKLQSDARRQQQERKDRQQHFNSQKHHLNNIHKNNYRQIFLEEDMMKLEFQIFHITLKLIKLKNKLIHYTFYS